MLIICWGNDIELLESSKEYQHQPSLLHIRRNDREVVNVQCEKLINLLRFRNTSKAFDLEGL